MRIVPGILVAAAAVLFAVRASAADPPVVPDTGNATIRAKAGPSEIVVTTTTRLAGAIHSVTWGGKEFIDSADHGRQLQSACSFDAGAGPHFHAEAYNPTEAGSRLDGDGPTSTSRLLYLKAADRDLLTATRMAFWLDPKEKSEGHPARNTTRLSDHLVAKHVTIGCKQYPHAIDYRMTFTVPPGEKHKYAQFEALTGYMPAEFEAFWALDPKTAALRPLTDGPGEQELPVILATATGSHAMGAWSPDRPTAGGPRYGRFRFKDEKVVKWNCVFRTNDPVAIPAGNYTYRVFVAVGSLDTVRTTLAGLAKEGAGRKE
ncbi:hypothetical protein [Fimbriiglobus ruber]|uniref:DUF3108 domain-containing protein n=1 Tax=Fimbriiglobus ruber TaxID=1908690 RepID=A0A225DQB2_9BACT|nr:hypothetical protein [Fimbriiglobus ruber]OWK38367.1 hypothetical protein FRUB_07487 [Fimbriiglobus ruber]